MTSPVIEIPSTHNDVLCAGMVIVVSRQVELPYTYKAHRCAFSVHSSYDVATRSAIALGYCPAENIVADILTKVLSKWKAVAHISRHASRW